MAVFDGPVDYLPYASLKLEWTPDAADVERRLTQLRSEHALEQEQAAASRRTMLGFLKCIASSMLGVVLRCLSCDISNPNAEPDVKVVAKLLSDEMYQDRLSYVASSNCRYFIDGLEAWAWWLRIAILLEGVIVAVLSVRFQDEARELFFLLSCATLIFLLASTWLSPFLDDAVDKTDVITRLNNLLIFTLAFVRTLNPGLSTEFLINTILFCISGYTLFQLIRSVHPIEQTRNFLQILKTNRDKILAQDIRFAVLHLAALF